MEAIQLSYVACTKGSVWVIGMGPDLFARVDLGTGVGHGRLIEPRTVGACIQGMAAGSSRVVAVGEAGTVWLGQDDEWIELTLPTPDLIDACVLADGTVMVCGEKGVRAHLDLDGRRVEIFNDQLVRQTVFDIASWGEQVHAVSGDGALLSWSRNSGWTLDRPDPSACFLGLACLDDTIWCVGAHGSVVSRRGGQWQTITSPFHEDLYNACVFQGCCYVGGEDGIGRVVDSAVEIVRDKPSDRIATDGERLYSVRDERIAWTSDGARWEEVVLPLGQLPASIALNKRPLVAETI